MTGFLDTGLRRQRPFANDPIRPTGDPEGAVFAARFSRWAMRQVPLSDPAVFHPRGTPPPELVFRLVLAVVLDTAVQILWKLAVLQLPDASSLLAAVEAASHQPLFLLVAGLFAWQLVNWLRVLESSDLSYAQPITALSLISVFVLSALCLGESVDVLKMVGIGFVFAGVWFISRTDHDSRVTSAIRQ